MNRKPAPSARRFQSVAPGEEHVYHLFQIRTEARDALLAHLRESGVDAVVRYPTPIHLQTAFLADYDWRPGQFPVAERLARQLLCLPIRPDLSINELDYVCDRVREFFTFRAAAARHAPELLAHSRSRAVIRRGRNRRDSYDERQI